MTNITTRRTLTALMLCFLLLVGCWMGLNQEATSSSNPLSRATWIDETVHGRVIEIKRASHYTYFKLKTSQQTRWVVVMEPPPVQHATVHVKLYARLETFNSPRLNMTFDRLYFGSTQELKEHAP